MLCILYVNVVGALLGFVGLLVERALPAGFARRWVWCLLIPMSMVLPGLYRANHSMSVLDMFSTGDSGTAASGASWWQRIESWDPLISRGWALASLLVLAVGVANVLRVAYLVYGARFRGASSASVVDGVPVVVTDSLGPATVGLWRSRVLLPQWVLALPRAQRQYVVRHEDEHRRAHDAHLLFVASLTLVLLPWNAALWWQLRRLRLAAEIDCDNRVVSALGDAKAYGTLLLTIAQATRGGPRLQPALLGGVGMLERRLRALLAPTPPRDVQRFLVPAMAAALLVLVLSMPHPVVETGTGAHDARGVSTSHASGTHK